MQLTVNPTLTPAQVDNSWRARVTRFWNDLPLRTKGLIVLAIPLIALLLGAIVFYLQDERERDASSAVKHSFEVKTGLQQVDLYLVRAESALRGFLNGGNPDTLVDLQTAQAELPATLDNLEILVSDNPEQTENLIALRSFVDQRLMALSTLRDAAIASGAFPWTAPEDLRQLASTARTDVRQAMDTIQTEEDRLLAERTASEESARSRTQFAVVLTLVIGLIGSLLATSLFTTGVVARVRRLASNADHLAEGEPIEPMEPARDEVGRLSQRLETASELLRQREAALASESRLLASLLDNIPYPVFFKDRQSRIIRTNLAAAKLVGSDNAAEFIGKTDFDFFPPEQAQTLFDNEQRMMETGDAIVNHVERSMLGGQGMRWGLDNKAPVYDQNGQVIGLVGSSADITVMKQAEEIAGHLAAIVDSSDDAIVGATLDGIITSWNAGAERLYGYTTGEAIGQPIELLGLPENTEELSRLLGQIAEGVSAVGFEFTQPTKSGRTFDASLTFSPVRDSAGAISGVALIARDISAQKQAEVALQAANKELEAFTYSVSHDLRAPLRAMNGFSRILIEDYATEMPEDARPYLQLVQDNARQMGRLVDDLLAFSRLGRQPVVTRPVRMTELAKQVYEDLHAEYAGREVEFEVKEIPVCEVDPGLMRQVFANLISNSLKFTRNRDVAKIEIGTVTGSVHGGEAVVYVKDNGVGFDMTYAHKLFGVFQRLHRAEEYDGTGVGLALVQRIVHRHGGRVWADSEVNKGATFYLALPVAATEAIMPEEAAVPAA